MSPVHHDDPLASERSNHTHVVCGECQTVIRVPTVRLQQNPQCPSCHSALFTDHPFTLNAANFDKHTQRNDLPLVVDVWAPWCGPCQAMAPHFEEAAHRLQPHWRFAKLNSDDEPQLSTQLRVRSIPTLIVFHHGRELARQSGLVNADRLIEWLTQLSIENAA